MAETKTVLNFPTVTDVQDSDILYLIRGIGSDRDKNIALGSLFNPLKFNNDGSALSPILTWFSDPDTGIFRAGTNILGFSTNGSEALRIDASGNIGINQITPLHKLHIVDDKTSFRSQNMTLVLERETVSTDIQGVGFINSISNDFVIGRNLNSDDLLFGVDTGAVFNEYLRINTDGNVGIKNNNLENWSSVIAAFQVGGNASITHNVAQGASGILNILQNAYYNGSWKYISTDEASQYQMFDGTHIFNVASSGTEDTAISWINALKIDNAGNIGIRNFNLKNWHSTLVALQIGGIGAVFSQISVAGGNDMDISANFYYNGVARYITNGYASRYIQQDGEHKFQVAPSGVADAAITESTVMKIENDGGIFFNSLLGSTGGSDARYNTSTKELFYDTSALKYKENIRDCADTEWIFNIPVKTFDRKDGIRKNEIGIIADDIVKIKPDFCCYDENGEVESYSKSDLIPLILNELQKLRKEFNKLKR